MKTVLLAGGLGTRMRRLGHNRLKPLIPFGGVCHLIDFSLRNAYCSGIPEVLLLSHYGERNLIRYLLETWSKQPGFRIHFGPYDGISLLDLDGILSRSPREQEKGTADAVLKNAPYIFDGQSSDVMVLHADHVYRFDYRPMIDYHRSTGAALTIGYQNIEREYVKLFGMVELDNESNLLSFVEKPANPTSNTVFSAVCIFRADVLQHYLSVLSAGDWQGDISRDVIPAMLLGGELIKGFQFEDYWEDIGTVERYHRAQLRLLSDKPTIRLEDMPHTLLPRYTRRRITRDRNIVNSIVSEDCETHAHITNSIVYPQTQIANSARIVNSVIFPGAKIHAGVTVENAIVLEGQIV